MATEANGPAAGRFVTAVLPWLAGVGALLVFSITLNRWVSYNSIGTVAWISGWTWQPELYHPITAVVLCPFRLLPEAWIPLALNLFTAGCAALVLVLLARSVALLPHDLRLRHGVQFAALTTRAAWIPPVLAVTACGLQLTFWEHATSITGEMVDLLVFAYVIRCLLEFRNDRNESWLARGTFLYAAGMTNHWVLIVYLPVFLFALVRLNGLRILNVRLLLRLSLWGLAGLSFYLLLPALLGLSSVHHVDFWTALESNLRFQRDSLNLFRRTGLGLLGLTTFLPLLVISFRWEVITRHPGDDNPSALLITRGAIHFVHAVLLAATLWLMLDPPFSPRKLGLGASSLTQYYVSALVAGYCLEYFLEIGSRSHGWRSRSRIQALGRLRDLSASLAHTAVCTLLLIVSLALILRNLSQIRATNGPAVHEFARQLYNGLPAGKSVVLSDDPTELFLLRAELGARGHDKDAILLDTRLLVSGQYQLFMARQFTARWPVVPATNGLVEVNPMNPRELLSALLTHEPLVYLHPSFDYCFELFADQPHAPIHRVVEGAASDAMGQRLDEPTAATNERYWQQRWTDSLQTLAGQTREQATQPPRWAAPLFDCLHLRTEQNRSMSLLGAAYARSLDYWGVQMQRLGQWKEAGLWFQRALELNPGNLAAQMNLEYNQRHQQGDHAPFTPEGVEARFADWLGKYRTWESVVKDNGPVDEPTFLCRTAAILWADRNYHQAAREFMRCVELAPDWLVPKLGLAESYLGLSNFGSALRLTESISASSPPRDAMEEAKVVSCRARALQGLGRREEADACIGSFVSQHPTEVLSKAARLYLQCKQYGPALVLLDQLLSREPNNPELLSRKGSAEMGLGRYDAAIATLTTAISVAPTNAAAQINRAIACLRAGQLDAARAYFQELLERYPNSFQVLYGLAEIALRRQDTNAAIEFYQRYLSRGSPQSDEYKLVSYGLKRLQGR
jgi:tetratricopeptide (TPR) repeat protein